MDRFIIFDIITFHDKKHASTNILEGNTVSHAYKKQHFHLRPKNVSYKTRLRGNEGQCFLYKDRKFIAFDVFTMLSTLI